MLIPYRCFPYLSRPDVAAKLIAPTERRAVLLVSEGHGLIRSQPNYYC